MSSKKALVPATSKMFKKGINCLGLRPCNGKKRNVVEKSITHHKGENKSDAINEIDKPQASQSEKDKYISNESSKYMSLNKPRASNIT